MTCGRATGSDPMTAAKASLGVKPAPGLAADLRGVFAAAVLAAAFLAGAFFAGTFLAVAPVAAARPAPVFVAPAVLAAVLRGGNLEGANSKLTLPASASHASMALKPRRVRMETN